jgi:hypothetical protein
MGKHNPPDGWVNAHVPVDLPVTPVTRYNTNGGGCPTIAKQKEETC